jgi:hypothetical protein
MALSVVLRVPGLALSPVTMLLMLMEGRPGPCWWPLVVTELEADPGPGVEVAGGGVLPLERMGRLAAGGCSWVSDW